MNGIQLELQVKDLREPDDLCCKTDCELAALSKNNSAAASALLSRYSKLIFVKSQIYANSGADCDDLRQEGLLGLFSAMCSYRPDKGTKFSTYAEICIENRMRTFLARGRARAESPVENIDEISELHTEPINETPESIYLYKEYFSELFSRIQSVLSDAEYRVFSLCVNGASYKKTAETLGVSEKYVDNAMQRARRKIRALIQR